MNILMNLIKKDYIVFVAIMIQLLLILRLFENLSPQKAVYIHSSFPLMSCCNCHHSISIFKYL